MTLAYRPGGTPQIVVIGAGIVGCSIAFHLALRGAQVTVVDSHQPGQGASQVSFAWINARDKNPRHYHDLNRCSLEAWCRFARRLGNPGALTWGGELRWAATPQGAEAFLQRVNLLQSWGYPIRQIERSDVQRLAPALQPGTVAAASYTEVDGHVDTAKVIEACLTRATHLGAQIEAANSVIGLDTAPQENETSIVQAVITEKGAIPCGSVVVAAGADTPRLAAHVDLDVPLHHTFGATILTEPLPPLLPKVAVVHTHVDVDPQMAFRQLADGSVMIHGGTHGGAQDRSLGQTKAEVEQVMAKATDLFPALEGVAVREVRRGRRPMPADGQSILGFTKSVPNLYLAATHSGVTLAPLIGELASVEIQKSR